MTTIVHLYGAPGAGKSTTAACLFSRLKKAGISTEIVTECAKDWVWGNRPIDKYGQTFLPAKQMLKETSLLNKVDVIVTDSPFPLGGFYYTLKYGDNKYEKFLLSLLKDVESEGHKILSFFIPKSKAHSDIGRIHSEEQSLEIEEKLKVWLFYGLVYGKVGEFLSAEYEDENYIFDRTMERI